MAGERLTLWTSATAAVATLGAVAVASFVIWTVTAKERAQFTNQVAALNAQVGALNDKVEKTNVTVADIKKLASLADTTKELDRLNAQIKTTNDRLGTIQKDASLDAVRATLTDLSGKIAAIDTTLDAIKTGQAAFATSVAAKPNGGQTEPETIVVYVPPTTAPAVAASSGLETTSGIPAAPLSVRFDKVGSTSAGDQANALIGNLKRIVKDRHGCTISVAGYADTLGSDSVNLDVSRERAEAVASKLRAAFAGQNVAIRKVAWGERQLKVWTPDGKSEKANRRVDISIDCKG